MNRSVTHNRWKLKNQPVLVNNVLGKSFGTEEDFPSIEEISLRWSKSFKERVLESDEIKNLTIENLRGDLYYFEGLGIEDDLLDENKSYYEGIVAQIDYWEYLEKDAHSGFGQLKAPAPIVNAPFQREKEKFNVLLAAINPGYSPDSDQDAYFVQTLEGVKIGLYFTVAYIPII